jgi:hypothetical protein
VAIRRIGNFLGGIPVPAWLQAVRSTLGLLGLGVIFLFVLSLVVYLNSGGFTTSERLFILAAMWLLALILYLIAALFTPWHGDPLYSPAERLLGQGRNYGTESHPQPRRRVLQAENQEPPIPNLLEGEVHQVDDGENPELPEEGEEPQ